jgi:hypothetical protein
MPQGFHIATVLRQDQFVTEQENSNLIEASRAFFAARVIKWIQARCQEDEKFNLPLYLTVLLYYRLGVVDLAFTDRDEQILYKVISTALGDKKHADPDQLPFEPIPQVGSIFDTEGCL